MKSYHFNIGDTHNNPLGLCARVTANSKAEAVEKLEAVFNWLGDTIDLMGACQRGGGGDVEYLNFYLNGLNVSSSDIDEWEFVESQESK